MRKKPTNPQDKHELHEVFIEPTTVAHHKYVMRCADCMSDFVKWATKDEFEIANQRLLNL